MKLSPVPTQPVPLLIGGHARPALRRAARTGDGWISANSDYDALRTMIASLDELRREYGTDNRDTFQIHAFDTGARQLDDFQRIAALGVTDICVTPWNPYDPACTLEDKLSGLNQFADNIIARFPADS